MPERDPATITGADFEDLLREVLARVNGALDEQARLRLLLDAVVSMAADLNLDGVLARIVEISRHLTGARYAALGVLNSGPRKGLRTFVHHGMTPVQVEEIGDLPTGHGILGLLIDRPEPLRLHEISAHPESYGFPPRHPPMRSFLGVPVRIRDQVFGNLYLTEKPGEGDFTQEDEEIVVALAAAAGVAIENARLYEHAHRREEWLAATAEITGLLSGSVDLEDALQLVADRARQVAGADVAWLVVGTPDELSLRALSGPPVTLADVRGVSMDKSLSHEVIMTGEPISSEDMSQDRRATTMDHIAGWPKIGPAIVVPLRARSEVVGALALGWTPDHVDEYHEVDPRLPASFAEQAALALQVVRSQENERRLALFEDRDRIGRDLHDLVIQRLFAVGLSLQSVSRVSEVPQVNERIDDGRGRPRCHHQGHPAVDLRAGLGRGRSRHPDRGDATGRACRLHPEVPAHARDRRPGAVDRQRGGRAAPPRRAGGNALERDQARRGHQDRHQAERRRPARPGRLRQRWRASRGGPGERAEEHPRPCRTARR